MKRFQALYKEDITKVLKDKFGYPNPFEIPKISAIYINMGVGKAVADKKHIDNAAVELGLIAGQKPIIRNAKKSIATFKLREGVPIGLKVTLRKKRMYEFLERLVLVAMPRTRDFKGFNKKSFDGHGNFSLGVKEHIVFPEINYDKTDSIKGLDITIVTTAKTDEEGKALLEAFYFPFVN